MRQGTATMICGRATILFQRSLCLACAVEREQRLWLPRSIRKELEGSNGSTYVEYYPNIYLRGLKKTTENHSLYGRFIIRN
jgi:hypothetical protein